MVNANAEAKRDFEDRVGEIKGLIHEISNESDKIANHIFATKKMLRERNQVLDEYLDSQSRKIFRLKGLMENLEYKVWEAVCDAT